MKLWRKVEILHKPVFYNSSVSHLFNCALVHKSLIVFLTVIEMVYYAANRTNRCYNSYIHLGKG